MSDRHLARTEAVQTDLALERVEPFVGLGQQIGGGDHNGEFALEAFGKSFGYLHHTIFVLGRGGGAFENTRFGAGASRRCAASMHLAWCGRRDSNPHDFRHGNLNPARLPIPPRPRALRGTMVGKRRGLYHGAADRQGNRPEKPRTKGRNSRHSRKTCRLSGGSAVSEQLAVDAPQGVRQVLGNKSWPDGVSGIAMKPNRRRSGLKR